MTQSELEATMAFQLDAAGFGSYECEYRWHPTRRWRADFCFDVDRVLIEVEGFGHHYLSRYLPDIEKYNEAAILGWTVIRVTGNMVNDGRALQVVERALKGRGDELDG